MKLKVMSILVCCYLAIWFTACVQAPIGPIMEVPSSHDINLEGSLTYTVGQKITLVNLGPGAPDRQTLWVALIHDFPPYQSAELKEIVPNNYQLVTDEVGNQYAEFDLSVHPPETEITVTLQYQVEVHSKRFDIKSCQGELPQGFTQPELHIESANPQIMTLSQELSKGTRNLCEQIRAYYDFVGDSLVYTYNQNDWGAQAALGEMGADCTEYSSLLMALSRAGGVPARYYEGLLYLENQETGIAQTEHAWLDVYLPGTGWVPMDPTLGRLPLTRESHFAKYTPDHIIITTGRNPSTLRGSSYWSHLYWPGDSTTIRVEEASWQITPVQ